MDCFTILMEHECDVYRLTTGTDAGFGVENDYTLRESGVKFLLNVSPAKSQERFAQDQLIGEIVGATFYTGVQRGDKLIVTAGPSLVGANLHVAGIKDQPGVASIGFDEILHISCERIV